MEFQREHAEAWRELVLVSIALGEALDRQSRRDAGMPHSYYAALVALAEEPDRELRMGELAARAGLSRSRLAHAVASMEASGWVEREPAPEDGRGAVARLTDAGHEAVVRIGRRQRDVLRAPALAGLDAREAAELARALAGIRSRLPAD